MLLASFESPATFAGGVETHAVALVRALLDEGVQARLATRRPDDGRTPDGSWGIPVDWIRLPLGRGRLPAYHHKRLMLGRFHRGVRRLAGAFDIVHGQNDAGMGALGRRPVVATVHTDVLTEFEAARLPLPRGLGQRVLVGADVLRWRRYARRLAACIAVGQGVASRLSGSFGLDPVVIPNGVDPVPPVPRFDARRRFGVTRARAVVSLGRLAPVKGIDRLVEAVRHLPLDVEVLIAGSGPAREALEQAAGGDGIGGRVRFLGFLQETDKTALLCAADAFVLPSRHEGQPIVLLEALAQKVPVVVSDAGWLPPELARHATVVPFDAPPTDLAAGIAKAMARGPVPDARVPSWRDVARRTIAVYEDALAGPGRNR